ncbi:MAG: hypothetical protein BEN18_10410 [Epulopiscium sp. Nuni2H_MBin001]|nr:MAG: hypothetical protein BEN18_10410 [Epulopiscium sp. Nuni2H_MBin001]
MLLKLIKHEFKATANKFYPIYALILITSFIYGNFFNIGYNVLSAYFNIVPVVLGCALVAQFVVLLMVTIDRFNKSLLGDEGYLMFTLPVTNRQLILSKTIVTGVWYFITHIVFMLSIMILTSDMVDYSYMFKGVIGLNSMFMEAVGTVGGVSVQIAVLIKMLQVGVVGLLTVAKTILIIYLALIIGSLVKRAKIVGLFSYIAINWVLTTFLGVSTITMLINSSKVVGVSTNILSDLYGLVATGINVATIGNLAICIAVMELISYILTNKKEL